MKAIDFLDEARELISAHGSETATLAALLNVAAAVRDQDERLDALEGTLNTLRIRLDEIVTNTDSSG